ncbi:hypothetical protein ACFPRL_09120 [Pseudoclavibacter helvolus]
MERRHPSCRRALRERVERSIRCRCARGEPGGGQGPDREVVGARRARGPAPLVAALRGVAVLDELGAAPRARPRRCGQRARGTARTGSRGGDGSSRAEAPVVVVRSHVAGCRGCARAAAWVRRGGVAPAAQPACGDPASHRRPAARRR